MEKARSFMIVADVALSDSYYDSATSLAVSAGVNFADALCLSSFGHYSTSANHEDAISLVRQSGPTGERVARHLRRLLKNKSKSQYSNSRCSSADAQDAVTQAVRIEAAVSEELARRKKG